MENILYNLNLGKMVVNEKYGYELLFINFHVDFLDI